MMGTCLEMAIEGLAVIRVALAVARSHRLRGGRAACEPPRALPAPRSRRTRRRAPVDGAPPDFVRTGLPADDDAETWSKSGLDGQGMVAAAVSRPAPFSLAKFSRPRLA